MGDGAVGPLGINPLHFSASLFGLLFLFVLYLLFPRGVRVQYFGSYPKRYAWSARSRSGRRKRGSSGGGMGAPGGDGQSYTGGSSVGSARTPAYGQQGGQQSLQTPGSAYNDKGSNNNLAGGSMSSNNEDIVVSAAMQQLRDPGVLIVAHGSRGKPKTVRLVLTETAITWRTEMRKKNTHGAKELKLGKLHQVPLSHIMYVDIGKQTTALRRVENASVSEALCFSLLTKEGSLDLEANSPRERDALVQCFSLVLDEVHAQNWRDIYRGPSSDMPSSFDEGDGNNNGGVGGMGNAGVGGMA
mmetsp:Transcript_5618/g.12783  ORF Transcript_5618/g.12783 Transcript_5618/m.12783 type:complete len:300 (+) Transcript_5618:140-1039(+)|eukprot:CAMPEP_0172313672 /NCGR_PEP_ID=MMETSP1058-20130122/20726_1 /TAXON_ID=83371 /ORGANISM="Detonula confervacea, Strain CCMP 353" /LENGTH=299 /DNA_ID=CAMNT_0013027367 /DNA_START=81 /DNA_END=983 /DNA_ORIENTATION=+